MKPSSPARPRQELPAELVGDLMSAVRGLYCGDPAWFKERHLIMEFVVSWPAKWLNRKGVSLPPDRYKQIVLGIIQGVKQHGETGKIYSWPAYLGKCVQEHFQHNGEQIYEEAKDLRSKVEHAVMAFQRAAAAGPRTDAVEALAQVNAALRVARRAKQRRPQGKQLSLL